MISIQVRCFAVGEWANKTSVFTDMPIDVTSILCLDAATRRVGLVSLDRIISPGRFSLVFAPRQSR